MRKKKLKIAVIQQTPDLGGAETYMTLLMKSFQENGENVLLVTNLEKFITYVESLKVKTFKIPFILDVIGNYKGLIKSLFLLPRAFVFYINLLRKLERERVNVIIMSGFSEKMLITFLSLFIKIPVVWFEYGALTTIFKRNFYIPKLLYKLLWRVPCYIIVPSQYTRKSLLQDTSIDPKKIIYIPDGVIVPKMKKGRKEDINPEWKDKFIIGNVSRLTREKGQQYLIQAMPLILEKIPHAILLIIGAGWDKNYFQSLVQKLDLGESVYFTDYVDDLDSYYNIMDVFVFPTVWELEGFGLVSAEAMAHGVPTLGSNFGPVPEVITHNVTGLLFKAGDEKALANSIIDVYNSPEKRKIFSRKGKEKVEKEFSIEKVSQSILHYLYRSTHE